MKISTEPLENRQLAVTIEVDDERTQQGMQRAARNIAKEVRVPGFRPGKAPFDVILQRFGESTIRREAADLLAEDIVREALSEQGIDAYAPGELTELTLDPITYHLTIPLVPTVELGDYREFRLEAKIAEVAEEQLVEALDKIREDNTIFESVERPSVWEDGIALDLVARVADGTEVLKGEDLHIVLEAGNTDPVPGFPEAIEGMTPGDERTFTLALPADFPQEAYVGQDAEFTVQVKDVYNQIIPALDDDLARTVGSYESLDELKTAIRDRMQAAAQAQQDGEYAAQVMEALVEQATIDYPPVVLEQELDQVVSEAERSITSQSRLSMDDFLRIEGKTKEEFRESLAPRAANRVKQALVLGEVVKLEALSIDEDEVEAGIDQASASWGSRAEIVRKSFESEAGQRAMANRLMTAKAIQRLVAIAKGVAEVADEEGGAVDTDEVEAGLVADELAPEEAVAAELITEETDEPEASGDTIAVEGAGDDVGEPVAELAEPGEDTADDQVAAVPAD